MAQAPISSTTPSRSHGSEPRLLNRPALIEHKHLRFLVLDAPSDSNLPLYVTVCGGTGGRKREMGVQEGNCDGNSYFF